MREFIRIQNKFKTPPPYNDYEWRDLVSETTLYRCEFNQINSAEVVLADAKSAVSVAKILIRPVNGLKASSRIIIDGQAWEVAGEPKKKSLHELELLAKKVVAG